MKLDWAVEPTIQAYVAAVQPGPVVTLDVDARLGRRVDVVTMRGLKARIRERVLREAVLL